MNADFLAVVLGISSLFCALGAMALTALAYSPSLWNALDLGEDLRRAEDTSVNWHPSDPEEK